MPIGKTICLLVMSFQESSAHETSIADSADEPWVPLMLVPHVPGQRVPGGALVFAMLTRNGLDLFVHGLHVLFHETSLGKAVSADFTFVRSNL